MMIVTIVTKACATPRRLTWFTKQFSLCKSESLGRVSLIAGLEYGMERWNGKWIKWLMYAITLTCATGTALTVKAV